VTVYVYRDGKLVDKRHAQLAEAISGAWRDLRSDIWAPFVSRFDAFESPVTGENISSWRQRERDMNAADAVDRRDIPESARENRRRIVDRNGRTGKTGN